MNKQEQVQQMTTYMANFVSHIAKVLPDDIIKKLVIHGLRLNDELEMLGTYHETFGDPEEDIPAAPEAPAQNEE